MTGMSVVVRGPICERESNGMFTVRQEDITLPSRQPGSVTAAITPSPKRRRCGPKTNPIVAVQDPADEVHVPSSPTTASQQRASTELTGTSAHGAKQVISAELTPTGDPGPSTSTSRRRK